MDVNKNLTASTITTGTTSPQEEQVRAMTNAIDTIADTQASGAASIDIPTVKLNFLIDLIKNFMKSIINILISPKLMTLFSLNFKILYGIASEYDGPIDFMKKNKNLIISIAKSVLEPIIKMLLSMVLKRLTAMISKKLSGDKIEQAKNYVAQLLSMLGIPQNIIRQIQGLI
jgi:F0F1-type ATP synthase delta subunit